MVTPFLTLYGEFQMATFGYGRVSTSTQTTENQKLELENNQFHIDYWFSDVGISGKTCALERPAFKDLLLKIRDGECLVVSKIDRLGRDAIDILSTVKHLSSRNIKVMVLQLGGTDLTSSTGKLLLTMLSAVAEMERSLIVERITIGVLRAKSKGKRLGRPPKTNDVQKQEIIHKIKNGSSISELARNYKVSRANIINIKNNMTSLS